MTTLVRQFGIAGILASSFLLTGCPVITPAKPPETSGVRETPSGFEHDLQVTWGFPELSLLQTLQIQHPDQVTVISSSDGDELTVQWVVDIEKTNHVEYATEYMQEFTAQSNLQSPAAALTIPVPKHPCKETVDINGQVTTIEGICVRAMTVVVPKSHMIPLSVHAGGDFKTSNVWIPILSLTLDDGTRSEISQFTGNLKIQGAGPHATVLVNSLQGDLDMELSTIKSAELNSITGKIHVATTQAPADSRAVTLDGNPITSFPFDRP